LGVLIFIFYLLVSYIATVLIVSCLVTSLSLFLIGKSLCLQSCFFNSVNVFTLFIQVFFKRSFKLRKSVSCSCLQDLQSISGLWCFCSYSILRHQSWSSRLFSKSIKSSIKSKLSVVTTLYLLLSCKHLQRVFISLTDDHIIGV